MKPRIPRKLSTAITMALVDQVKAEKCSNIHINMSYWHSPSSSGICHMCFAGAVMHFRHNTDLNKSLNEDDQGKEWSKVYEALDCVRSGYIIWALSCMDLINIYHMTSKEQSDFADNWNIQDVLPDYEDDPEEFRSILRETVKKLKEAGY